MYVYINMFGIEKLSALSKHFESSLFRIKIYSFRSESEYSKRWYNECIQEIVRKIAEMDVIHSLSTCTIFILKFGIRLNGTHRYKRSWPTYKYYTVSDIFSRLAQKRVGAPCHTYKVIQLRWYHFVAKSNKKIYMYIV